MIRYRWPGSPEHPEPIAFIGLSDENLHALREGLPIKIAVDDNLLGLGIELVIHHGKTEVEMTRELEENGFMPPGSTEATERALAQRSSVSYRHHGPGRGGTKGKRA